ncbi:MAG TPA: PQQ-binding-like beta-propeller repeat protein [Candidatus Limnocylindrales bacterium]|nr:PQQ-binding-like beta-propeller repeat protein [Candidatus Limnocylindrales bacterium]
MAPSGFEYDPVYFRQKAKDLLRTLALSQSSIFGKPEWSNCGIFAGTLGLALATSAAWSADANWSSYLGDPARSHFSQLKQIHRRNVSRLEAAWTYHSGDARSGNLSQIQCNPLIIDGVLYGTTPQLKLIALDAATGHELWRFDPTAGDRKVSATGVNRGVVCWGEGSERRIIYSVDHFLYAIDAGCGRPVARFGNEGRVDIKDGLGRDVSKLFVSSTTPGAVFQNLLFLPMRLGEGPAPAAPGHLRAFDLRTGKIVWTFHTIPYPGEPGYETWPPDAWTYVGGVNCWAGMSVDERRGLVFVPTGSAAFDFWGGNRIGQNLYANCLLALDARTGRRVWHYQFVHHDVWDRDLPAPPDLVSVKRDGRSIDAVAQTTKSGHVFLFNRETGEPLFPIEERPVPRSDLDGEATWPTQPVPVKPLPFARQLFSYNEITDLFPDSRRAALERFSKVRPHLPFAPPSTQGTIIFPGYDGGGEWGGAAVDPGGVLYVNANEMPWILEMVPTKSDPNVPVAGGAQLFAQICAACHGLDRRGNRAQNVPSLVGVGQKLKTDEVVRLLGTGRGVMPSFGFLSERQKTLLAATVLGVEEVSDNAAHAGTIPGDNVLGGIPYSFTGYNRWVDTNGYPVVKPPWGTLNAIDLNTGDFRWRVPLGELPALKAQGIPRTGLENYGGPVVTAGDLLFIAATKDEMLRAFDTRNGEFLWEAKLPAGGYATPATYLANGRQYVVIACGGGKMGTKSGDAYVAFALPRK